MKLQEAESGFIKKHSKQSNITSRMWLESSSQIWDGVIPLSRN